MKRRVARCLATVAALAGLASSASAQSLMLPCLPQPVTQVPVLSFPRDGATGISTKIGRVVVSRYDTDPDADDSRLPTAKIVRLIDGKGHVLDGDFLRPAPAPLPSPLATLDPATLPAPAAKADIHVSESLIPQLRRNTEYAVFLIEPNRHGCAVHPVRIGAFKTTKSRR